MHKLLEMPYHLLGRKLNTYKYAGLFMDEECTTFLLYNLSGQIVGYQVYSPNKEKNTKLPPREQKYFTHVTKGQIAVWGLESYVSPLEPLYLVEGVFEACRLHNFSLQAVAVMGSNPEHLRNWLWSLPNKKIAVCQGDKAGKMLAEYGNEALQLTEGKDCGDFSDEELLKILGVKWNGQTEKYYRL